MIIWYLAIAVVSCWGMRFQANGSREDFLAPKVGNPILRWCGRHVFPIYMYQCLFFLLVHCLYHGRLTTLGAHFVVALILTATLIVARFYHHWEILT